MGDRLQTLRIATAASWLSLMQAGCGGGGGATPPPPPPPPPAAANSLDRLTVPGFPHAVDVYAAAGATRAIVFLHGGSGSNYQMAYSVGLNASRDPATPTSINWAWLTANRVLAVFPQGQTIPAAPKSFTWSNHAMTSGQDDVAFLKALAADIRARYGLSSVALAGHSMGGTMTHRMWCESPGTFNAYVSIAGPASRHYNDPATPCAPATKAPYLSIIGSDDGIMQTSGKWEAATWMINPAVSLTGGFVDPVVIGEWVQHGLRAGQRCGETPALADKAVAGAVETWSNCGGAIVQRLVIGADHGIDTLDAKTGVPVLSYVGAFTEGR